MKITQRKQKSEIDQQPKPRTKSTNETDPTIFNETVKGMLKETEAFDVNGSFSSNPRFNTFEGTKRKNIINGTNRADLINGNGGNDTTNGKGGNDIINGGNGNDVINGNSGRDDINGNKGNDTINAGDGNDTIRISLGSDTIDGGKGKDTVFFQGHRLDYLITEKGQVTIVEHLKSGDTHTIKNVEDMKFEETNDSLEIEIFTTTFSRPQSAR